MWKRQEHLPHVHSKGYAKKFAVLVTTLAMLLGVTVVGTALAEDSQTTPMVSSEPTLSTEAMTSDSNQTESKAGGTDDGEESNTTDESNDTAEIENTDESNNPSDFALDSQIADSPATTQLLDSTTLNAERWIVNKQLPNSSNYVLAISASNVDVSSTDGAKVEDLADSQSGYSFWKVSLKGTDGETNYGPKQTVANGDDKTTTGAAVTRIRYSNSKFQFMINDNWVSISGDGSDLQLVFYYMQVTTVGQYVNLHLSDWYVTNYRSRGTNPPQTPRGDWTPKAVIAEVVDLDTGTQLAKSETMYYYYSHAGVKVIWVSEQNLSQYEIASVQKYKAWDQTDSEWTSTQKAAGGLIATYPVNADMNTTWVSGNGTSDANGPVHVIFTINVRRAAEVSLVKQLSQDEGSQVYSDRVFGFTAQVTLPQGSDSVLRTSYPATGLAVGSSVNSAVSADGKTAILTGIMTKPGQKVTIQGLPQNAEVLFSEIGVYNDGRANTDPSLFDATFANDADPARTDGSAVAKQPPTSGQGDAIQTVTATNTLSNSVGKLSVTKTFTNIGQLNDMERMKLRDSFNIVLKQADGSRITTLRTANAVSASPTGGLTDASRPSEVTYTWTMDHLDPGTATLTEYNYLVGDYVSTSVEVNTNGAVVADATETSIETERRNVVKFTNEYDVVPIDVTMSKQWADDVSTHPDNVTVRFVGKVTDAPCASGTEGGSSALCAREVYSKNGVVLSGENDWTQIVGPLPPRLAGTDKEIVYSIVETKVGDVALADSIYNADYSGNQQTGLMVTNSERSAEPPAVTISVVKVIADDEWHESDSFDFTISAVSPQDAPLPDSTTLTVNYNSDAYDNGGVSGKAQSFGQITYATPGTYQYTVTEDIPSDPVRTIQYSRAAYEVSVTVPDDLATAIVTVTQTKDDSGQAISNAPAIAENATVFTNRRVPATSLPKAGASAFGSLRVASMVMFACALLMGGTTGIMWRRRQLAES